MPKTQMDQNESKPTRTIPDIQPALPPFITLHKINPDLQDNTSTSVNELLITPRTHLSKTSIQLGNPKVQPEPIQHILLSPTKSRPTPRSVQQSSHLPQMATTSDTKSVGSIAGSHEKDAVTMDLG